MENNSPPACNGTAPQASSCAEDSSATTVMTTLGGGKPSAHATSTYSEGGYDYELVGITDSRYECPICLLCFRDPVLTTCGHKFCSGCIRVWVVDLGGKCPVDGVSLSHENIFPDNFTRREIMQSKAKCPYTTDGCEIILPISDLDRHVHTEHRNDAAFSVNGSPHFSTGGADVSDCWFKEFGCDIRVHPSEMHKHTVADVHKHLHLMTMAYKRLKLYSSSRSNLDHPPDSFWRQDSRESQRWLLDDTLDSDDFEFRRQRSWDSVRFAQNKHNAKARPRFYPPRLAESDESLCKPHANHGDPPTSGEPSSSRSSTMMTPFSSNTNATQQPNSHQLNDVFERLVRLEQNDREKQIKIERLQSELASAVNLFSAATNIIKDLTSRYCNGVFVWTITDFRRLCMEMRNDPNRVRHSQDFYTDIFGYRMCLRFNLTTPSSHGAAAIQNANVALENDKDTFISLYVHFMQGQFDDTLPWPFSGVMKLVIIHPSNPDESIVETIIAKPGIAYAKPSSHRNATGIGFPEFSAMDKTFHGGYVKNDALICKILAKAHHIETKDFIS